MKFLEAFEAHLPHSHTEAVIPYKYTRKQIARDVLPSNVLRIFP